MSPFDGTTWRGSSGFSSCVARFLAPTSDRLRAAGSDTYPLPTRPSQRSSVSAGERTSRGRTTMYWRLSPASGPIPPRSGDATSLVAMRRVFRAFGSTTSDTPREVCWSASSIRWRSRTSWATQIWRPPSATCTRFAQRDLLTRRRRRLNPFRRRPTRRSPETRSSNESANFRAGPGSAPTRATNRDRRWHALRQASRRLVPDVQPRAALRSGTVDLSREPSAGLEAATRSLPWTFGDARAAHAGLRKRVVYSGFGPVRDLQCVHESPLVSRCWTRGGRHFTHRLQRGRSGTRRSRRGRRLIRRSLTLARRAI